jgi:pyruvate/2-oxoacid:ferredoxin oxidoreductase beta subunit
MKTISMGTKKKQFKSIRLAAEAAGVNYITFYMRLRAGDKPAEAAKKPVRKYQKQEG